MEQVINKSCLHEQLVRAAQVRSAFTLVSVIVALFVIVAIPETAQNATVLQAIIVFGVPLAVMWIVTIVLCKRMVVCTACGGSLWMCGTGNFKPRRMRIKDGVNACPHCGIPIA